MPEINNNFLKGKMNQDLDSRLLQKGEYREAINLLISRSEGSTVGEFENILGNTNVGTVSSTHKLNVIGNFIDQTNNRVYAFATDFSNDDPNSRATSSATCVILEFDLANPSTPNTLVSGFFLNFNKEFPIYGVNLLEELLFWTDNFNQPRRINITTARNNGSAYTKELQISVAKYYPYDAIIPMERQTVITGAGGTTTQINITPGNTNIRVGDIVTDNDKTDVLGLNATITNTSPPVKVVQILNPGTNTQFKVAPAITPNALAAGIKIDFSRTSMENRSDPDKSNYSTQTVGTIMAGGSGMSGTNLYPYATYPITGATPGTYAGEPGVDAGFTTDSTSGTGTGDITVVVNGLGGVSSIDAASDGTGWVIGDTITVSSSVIGGSTDVVITLTAASVDTTTTIRIDSDALLGGVPRVGDIVTNLTTPNNTPFTTPIPGNPTVAAQFNLRISQLNISQVDNTDSGRWTIYFDSDATVGGVITGFTVNDSIAIATNPLYESNFPGDTKFLDDKFVRFSYRFKFNDNEYSLMAPFSQIMFIPKQYGEFNLGQIDNKLLPSGSYSEDPGINNYYQDETDAYTSTILEWFENDIDSIGLKIPLPDTALNTQSVYNIKGIEILYRESDALAVKVLDSIDVSAITASQTYTIDYDDDLHGLLSQLYYNYTYKSNKPYKTLPEGQTTRVYDKVPIKALGQEIITNRVVYGNYVERMTPPSSIPYAVGFSDRDAQSTDYYTQYPFSTVKQNRIYQVGFVLVDYFGRQSDVILSSYDNQNLTSTVQAGSSMFVPYRGSGDSSIFNWIGTNLTLVIDEAIGTAINNTSGEPGVYKENGHVTQTGFTLSNIGGNTYYANKTYNTTTSGDGVGCTVRVTEIDGGPPGKVDELVIMTSGSGYRATDILTIAGGTATITLTEVGVANPLGWYSYKVVVKQQEQEYYNVYIPGFINGLPVQDLLWNGVTEQTSTLPYHYPSTTPLDTERGKIVFSTLLGDNINKIPRNLKEVGPTDEEYNSEEILYIRINNPNTTDTLQVRNLQYYPGTLAQNVLNIATVKETELAAVPFQPFNIAPSIATGTVPVGGATTGNQGEYGSTTLYIPSGTTAEERIPTGRLPWGDVANKESFYAADQNPFIMKFSTVGNYGNPVGAIVAGPPLRGTPPLANSVAHDSNYVNGIRAMEPCLSVAETKPVRSLLDLFWETTLTGKLEELNAGIESNYDGIVGITASSGTFAESITNSSAIGPQFKFINGSGAEVSNVQSVPVITKVYRQDDVGQTQINPGFFTVGIISAGTTYQINAAAYFWYSTTSNENPSSDVYIFDLQIVSGNTGQFTDTLTNTLTLTLTNVAPAIYSDAAYTTDVTGTSWTAPNVDVGESTILQLYGANGTNLLNTDYRTEQLIWEIAGGPGTNISDFDISSEGLITTNTTLTNEQNYTITVSLTDVNDTGSNKETVTATFNFTAGTANAPKIIGTGSSIASDAQKDMAAGTAEFAFINSDTYTGSAVGSPFSITPTHVYNAQGIYNGTAAGQLACPAGGRADLFQGTIEIKPKLFNETASTGDVTILFSIQYRTPGVPWSNIDTATGSTNTWVSTQSQQQINHPTGSTGQTAYTYKFDQLGEYRVITNQMSKDNVASIGQFTVDFKDGTYNTSAGPCVPA